MSVGQLTRGLAATAPSFTAAEAERAVGRAFGISGTCHRLAGYRDLNFRVTESDGQRHLFKIWHHDRARSVIDLHLQLLAYLERTRPRLPVPWPEPTPTGETLASAQDAQGRAHACCLLSWLDGPPLRDAPPSADLGLRLGHMLATLDQALEPFHHPAQQRDMLWDLSRADRLRTLSGGLPDRDVRTLVEECLADYEALVLPALAGLRRQVIHGDFNLDNVLITPGDDPDVCGIVDFGDALEAPRICEVAIACAYQLGPGDDPLATAMPVITGYHQALPLEPSERAVLAPLIRARLVGSVVITSFMAGLHPENREYLLVDTADAADRLRRLSARPVAEDTRRIESALQA